MTSKGCYRNGKFFLKSEAKLLDQIKPGLREKVMDIWPQYTSQITDEELKEIISKKAVLDPDFREFLKTLKLT